MTEERTGLVSTTRLPFATVEGLGRANAGLILGAVLADGPLARAEIAERVGLTRATVTRVVTRLLELGLLREGSPRRDSPGRPMVPLTLAGDDRAVVAVHFGAHECRVGLVDLRGRVLDESRDRYASAQPAAIVEMISQRVTALSTRVAGQARVLGIGASIGGWLRSESGEVVRFDPLGWRHVPLGSLLAESIDLPIHLDQVVRGLALAERMFGAARGIDDFVEMWIGTVVGAAVVHDGVVQRGVTGAAGMIAHLPTRDPGGTTCDCGRSGCLETSINDDAVLEAARSRGIAGSTSDVRDVVDQAQRGGAQARALLAEKGTIAGESAAVLADLIDPAAWVVAGVSTTADVFLEAFSRSFSLHSQRADQLEVRASAFGDLAPTIASASVLLDAYYRDPLGFERAAPPR
jgi:predicted NBD/HSP70 family sugar kinase